MGLLDLLGTSTLGMGGKTPQKREGANNNSKLHFNSSINNNPEITQEPSKLDLNGQTPKQYVNNLPK